MRYEEDGEYAIKKLDGMEWGYKKRPLKLQWSRVRTVIIVSCHACIRVGTSVLLHVHLRRREQRTEKRARTSHTHVHISHTQMKEADRQRANVRPTTTLVSAVG